MKWTRKATILCLTISVTSFARAQTIASSEAKNHIEGKAASCGKVASERPATSSRGTPTYVDLDQPCDQGLWPRAGNRGLGAGLFTGLLLHLNQPHGLLGSKLPSPSIVFDIPIDLESRILLLENRLRELVAIRQNPLDGPAKLARVYSEAELINVMISHYRTAVALEQRFKEGSTDS
jgi:hypothetical protein